MVLRLSDGSNLTGRAKFVAKDCMLFEETPGGALITVALAHVAVVRFNG
ncbi:MAG TPA: hypothetical protein VMU50_16905 [Polyangia bacterium]|nr:hypothetical protein [Polyangia bacterium]